MPQLESDVFLTIRLGSWEWEITEAKYQLHHIIYTIVITYDLTLTLITWLIETLQVSPQQGYLFPPFLESLEESPYVQPPPKE